MTALYGPACSSNPRILRPSTMTKSCVASARDRTLHCEDRGVIDVDRVDLAHRSRAQADGGGLAQDLLGQPLALSRGERLGVAHAGDEALVERHRQRAGHDWSADGATPTSSTPRMIRWPCSRKSRFSRRRVGLMTPIAAQKRYVQSASMEARCRGCPRGARVAASWAGARAATRPCRRACAGSRAARGERRRGARPRSSRCAASGP